MAFFKTLRYCLDLEKRADMQYRSLSRGQPGIDLVPLVTAFLEAITTTFNTTYYIHVYLPYSTAVVPSVSD